MAISTKKCEQMRYQPNKDSFNLSLIGITLLTLATFLLLNSISPTGVGTIIKILLIIIILLMSFLSAEKSKSYDLNHSQRLMGIGAGIFLLNFWYPLILLIATMNDDTERLGSSITSSDNYALIIPGNGYVRFVLAVLLLTSAAASLFFAGFTGAKRSKALNNYLKSINAAK